jgi:hypothetical protein
MGTQWIEHRIVPYRLEFDWWVRQAGCEEPAVGALIELASAASPSVRRSLGLEFDSAGRVTAFQEPMLVVRAESESLTNSRDSGSHSEVG